MRRTGRVGEQLHGAALRLWVEHAPCAIKNQHFQAAHGCLVRQRRAHRLGHPTPKHVGAEHAAQRALIVENGGRKINQS